MSAAKFTPGPWRWESWRNASSLDGADRTVLYHSAMWRMRKADRALIAAAPEMYRALRDLLTIIADDNDDTVEEFAEKVAAGHAALAKAVTP